MAGDALALEGSMIEAPSSCLSPSSFGAVEGADWVPNPSSRGSRASSLASSLQGSPRKPATPDARSDVSPQAREVRRLQTPEGCDWRPHPEVLVQTVLSPALSADESKLSPRELLPDGSECEVILVQDQCFDKEAVIETEPASTVDTSPSPSEEELVGDEPQAECDYQNLRASSELHKLTSEEGVAKLVAITPPVDAEEIYELEPSPPTATDFISSTPRPALLMPASPSVVLAEGIELARAVAAELAAGASRGFDAGLHETPARKSASLAPKFPPGSPAQQFAKLLEEKVEKVLSTPGAVMRAATPVRAFTPGVKTIAGGRRYDEPGTASRQESMFGTPIATPDERRVRPGGSAVKSQPSLPFSASSQQARTNPGSAQLGRMTGSHSKSKSKSNYAFHPSPRSLALGPPRGSARARQEGERRAFPARSQGPQSKQSSPPTFPFSDKPRAPLHSPSPSPTSQTRDISSRSVRMPSPPAASTHGRSPAKSPPPQHSTPSSKLCGSACIPHSVRRAVSSAVEGSAQSSSHRSQLYPCTQSGVSRFSSLRDPVLGSRCQASSAAPSQPPADNNRSSASFCSPRRSLGATPMNLSYVAPPLPSYAAPLPSYVAPTQVGSYVAPPTIESSIVPGSSVPPPAQLGSYVAPPTRTAITSGSYVTAIASGSSASMSTPVLAPQLPQSLSLRCTSPSRSLTSPSLPASLACTSPGRSFVAAPPAPAPLFCSSVSVARGASPPPPGSLSFSQSQSSLPSSSLRCHMPPQGSLRCTSQDLADILRRPVLPRAESVRIA